MNSNVIEFDIQIVIDTIKLSNNIKNIYYEFEDTINKYNRKLKLNTIKFQTINSTVHLTKEEIYIYMYKLKLSANKYNI